MVVLHLQRNLSHVTTLRMMMIWWQTILSYHHHHCTDKTISLFERFLMPMSCHFQDEPHRFYTLVSLPSLHFTLSPFPPPLLTTAFFSLFLLHTTFCYLRQWQQISVLLSQRTSQFPFHAHTAIQTYVLVVCFLILSLAFIVLWELNFKRQLPPHEHVIFPSVIHYHHHTRKKKC